MSVRLAGSVQKLGSGSKGNTRAKSASASGMTARDTPPAMQHGRSRDGGPQQAIGLDRVDDPGEEEVGAAGTAGDAGVLVVADALEDPARAQRQHHDHGAEGEHLGRAGEQRGVVRDDHLAHELLADADAEAAATAIGKLTMPPTMAAAKPLIDSRNSRPGLDEITTDARAMPATAATIEPLTHDTTESWRADTPSSEATSRSVATARMARPVAVKRKKAHTTRGQHQHDGDDARAARR